VSRKDVAVDDHHISSTPHSVFSRTLDLLCYQRILAFLTFFMHPFIPTVFVAFVRFWHVLRSAVLHPLLRDHFIQITETTNNDPYSSSPQHLGTRIFDRHFSGIHITIHTNHRLIHVSTPTAFLCGGIKKKTSIYPGTFLCRRKKSISSGEAETFSGVFFFFFAAFQPKHISSLLSGGDNSPKRIFILPGVCSGAGGLLSVC